MNVFERERSAIDAHRKTMQGSSLPPPKRLEAGTFTHGFFLPFSLIVATLRDQQLRAPYLRVTLVRLAVVTVIGAFAIANGNISSSREDAVSGDDDVNAPVDTDPASEAPKAARRVHVDLPGLHMDVDQQHDQAEVSVLGQKISHSRAEDDEREANEEERAVDEAEDEAEQKAEAAENSSADPRAKAKAEAQAARAEAKAKAKADRAEARATARAAREQVRVAKAKAEARAEAPKTFAGRAWATVRASWAWLLTLFAFLSAIEGGIVFFSRRWDDWLSFHASRLAKIVPEDRVPCVPKLAIDVKWLYRKARRRFRGYVVFAAGLPALLPLRLIPTVGPWLFTIAATLWGWYWLGVFSAAKSAHAWADEATAPSPLAIRTLNARVAQGRLVWPLRMYGRLWARLTRGVNPAAATFERSPRAFLGLALARALLSLPGLYLLARPIVPVAAGRLCAEGDPADRFSAQPLASAGLPKTVVA